MSKLEQENVEPSNVEYDEAEQEEDDEDEEEYSPEEILRRQQIMKEQEAKMKKKGNNVANVAQHQSTIDADRQFFDSADYEISGKKKSAIKKETIPATVKKQGKITHLPHHLQHMK